MANKEESALLPTMSSTRGSISSRTSKVSLASNSNLTSMKYALTGRFFPDSRTKLDRVGHYTFEECGDVINPTLGLVVGQNYTFVQADRSNYYHPLGFPNTPNSFLEGEKSIQRDAYTRRFFEPSPIWISYDEFSVQVRFDDANQKPYYECLLHQGMEGSIVLLRDGSSSTAINDLSVTDQAEEPVNAITTFVDNRSEFDKACGTYGLGQFQLPNPLCPDRFICGTEDVTDELQHFSACLEAANCAMMSGMTTGVRATDDSALFIHQMIPHHQNAVNTAKTLLKMGSLLCPDLTDQSNPNCVLEGILREIVVGQNHQIQMMRKFLSDFNYPQEDNCDVFVETVTQRDVKATGDGSSKQQATTSGGVMGWKASTTAVLAVSSYLLWLLC